jgi:hypothetical protein
VQSVVERLLRAGNSQWTCRSRSAGGPTAGTDTRAGLTMLPNAGESAARIDTGMAIAKLSSDSPLSSNTLCSAPETVTSSASFTVAPWL